MSTAPAATPPATVHPQEKVSSEKSTYGDVTVLTLRGTLHEGFEGRKLADSIRTTKIVMMMRDVRRIASWGMVEWMDFLRVLGERDVYIVECSTYATSQLNLVTGLLGHAKLVSFYAGYRCRSCNTGSEGLSVIPRDRAIIRDLPTTEYECGKCGGRVRLEEYPAAFFDTIADRESFDIEDDVLGVLRSRFKYNITSDVTRFRAHALVQDELSYLRLSGNLSRLVPDRIAEVSHGMMIVDLEGVIFNENVEGWRTYLDGVLPKLDGMQLVHAPVGFLEHAVTSADLRGRVKVRSFAMAYECLSCQSRSEQVIDVAANLEELVQGKLPAAGCASCKASLVPLLTPDLLSRLKALPARDRDPVLEKFVAKARSEPTDKLRSVLAAVVKTKAPPASETGRRSLFAILGLILLLLGGVTWFAVDTWRTQNEQRAATAPVHDAAIEKPQFVRPDWITSDAALSAYCLDMINRLMCIGVSSLASSRDEAVAQATDAALDELVYSIGLRITEPAIKDRVAASQGVARSKMLADMYAAEIDRTSPQYVAAVAAVVKARHQVVQAFRASGGPAVPTQRADWYWEEYAGKPGKPNEQLVFVRYDIGVDVLRELVMKYSTVATVGGTSLITLFPGISWQAPQLSTGAIVLKVARRHARPGLAENDIIVAVGKTPVVDAAQVVHHLQAAAQAGEATELGVVTETASPKTLQIRP